MRLEFACLKRGHQSFPIIDVKLKGSKQDIIIKAMIDSGASYSVFRYEVADYLEIDIEKGMLAVNLSDKRRPPNLPQGKPKAPRCYSCY